MTLQKFKQVAKNKMKDYNFFGTFQYFIYNKKKYYGLYFLNIHFVNFTFILFDKIYAFI